jgi:uncharacterized protein
MAETTAVVFELAGKQVETSCIVYSPDHPRATLILGHGAGAPQNHPWMISMARALNERSIECVTFNFLYTEAKRRLPDKGDVLEATWRAVIDQVRKSIGKRPLFIGGKSMGGRIATMVAANGEAGLAGLVLLGYPLHPPDKPEQLRVKHLSSIQTRCLFIQGERDPFGSPDELRPYTEQIPGGAKLVTIEAGDHSFAVPKRTATPEQIMARVADQIAAVVGNG